MNPSVGTGDLSPLDPLRPRSLPKPGIRTSIGRAFSRVYHNCSQFLLSLGRRIAHAVAKIFTPTPSSHPQPLPSSSVSSIPTPTPSPKISPVVQKALPKQKQKTKKQHPLTDLSSKPAPKAEALPKPVPKVEILPKPVPKVESPLKPASPSTSAPQPKIEPKSAPQPKIQPKASLAAPPSFGSCTMVEVPDDGNCLLYAITVGLNNLFINHPDIQGLLGWKVDPAQLTGNLHDSAALLKQPAATLRQQAADWLEANKEDGNVVAAIMSGVDAQRAVATRQIAEQRDVVAIVEQDIAALTLEIEALQPEIETLQKDLTAEKISKKTQQFKERQLKTKEHRLELKKNELERVKEHLKSVRDDIQSQTENLPTQETYVDLTRGDNVYTSEPHIYALSKRYGIPIRVLQPNQPPLTYNEEVNRGRAVPLPMLTIAYVNGNHYRHVVT